MHINLEVCVCQVEGRAAGAEGGADEDRTDALLLERVPAPF